MATTRTRKTTPAKQTAPARKTTPRKAPAKQAPAKKTAAPLPVRTRPWMTDAQGYATLAARIAGIPTFLIQDWRSHRDDTATRTLDDGTLLHYDLATRTLTWQATCPMGAVHEYPLTGPSAAAARVHLARCTTAHADLSVIPALTADELAELGILHTPTWAKTLPGEPEVTETLPVPLPVRPRVLADQLTHSRTATADTETPKEHPQP